MAYVCTSGKYDDYHIEAIFSAPRAAIRWFGDDLSQRDAPAIEEWEMNPHPFEGTRPPIEFVTNFNGRQPGTAMFDHSYDVRDPVPSPSTVIRFEASAGLPAVIISVACRAESREQALEIALAKGAEYEQLLWAPHLDTPPYPWDAVEVDIHLSGSSDEAVIASLGDQLTVWHLYGIRHSISGDRTVQVSRNADYAGDSPAAARNIRCLPQGDQGSFPTMTGAGAPRRLQCKDVPTEPILRFLLQCPGLAHRWPEYPNSILRAFPEGTHHLLLPKMRQLIAKKLVDGCGCGCRGDFEIATRGIAVLRLLEPTYERVPSDGSTLILRPARVTMAWALQRAPIGVTLEDVRRWAW